MKNFYKLIAVMVLVLVAVNLSAHSDEIHEDDKEEMDDLSVSVLPEPESDEINYFGDLLDDLSYDDFPTLHPLIVHIPVVLIPLALVFAVISILGKTPVFLQISVAVLSIGVIGGFISSFPLHPHTDDLSQEAATILSKHDFFAYTTLWLGSISAFLGIVYCYSLLRSVKWIYVAMLVLVTIAVSITGHYGGELTYIHGVGAQGNFLEDDSRGDSHE